MVDKELQEIEERVKVGYVTEDDILHLLERAKHSVILQERLEETWDKLDELKETLSRIEGDIELLEDVTYQSN